MSDIGKPYIPPHDPRPAVEKTEERRRGQMLRAIRMALGIGMREVAESLGVSVVELCSVERGTPYKTPKAVVDGWFTGGGAVNLGDGIPEAELESIDTPGDKENER